MKTRIDFNVNHIVYVKLTQIGRLELERQHEKLQQTFPNIRDHQPKKEDENGWSSWQMHKLMNTFGHLCYNGASLPFETGIQFEI